MFALVFSEVKEERTKIYTVEIVWKHLIPLVLIKTWLIFIQGGHKEVVVGVYMCDNSKWWASVMCCIYFTPKRRKKMGGEKIKKNPRSDWALIKYIVLFTILKKFLFKINRNEIFLIISFFIKFYLIFLIFLEKFPLRKYFSPKKRNKRKNFKNWFFGKFGKKLLEK